MNDIDKMVEIYRAVYQQSQPTDHRAAHKAALAAVERYKPGGAEELRVAGRLGAQARAMKLLVYGKLDKPAIRQRAVSASFDQRTSSIEAIVAEWLENLNVQLNDKIVIPISLCAALRGCTVQAIKNSFYKGKPLHEAGWRFDLNGDDNWFTFVVTAKPALQDKLYTKEEVEELLVQLLNKLRR